MADKLKAAEEAALRLRAAETELDEAREAFNAALREAHRAGASYALLGRTVGLSRQRVSQIVEGT